jgi:(1->4)-alpha-D-glucan 1-alpha-D-glucosylmutase
MAATAENRWWADVLRSGRASPYAFYFDIDWVGHPKGRLLLPILGAPVHMLLQRGEIAVTLDADGFVLRYGEARLPLDPASFPLLLSLRPRRPRALAPVLDGLARLPAYAAAAARQISRSRQTGKRLADELWRLYVSRSDVHHFIDKSLLAAGKPENAGWLEALLAIQPYELSYWRIGGERLNYRRFFDVTGLIGMRVEEPDVFGATHPLILQLARENGVTGLRVDHIDGLRDPLGYLRRLRDSARDDHEDPYLLVEKILLGDEVLPQEWPVSGTTGYEFARLVNGLFVDAHGSERMRTTYRRFTGLNKSFSDVAYGCKRRVIKELFPGELRALSRKLSDLLSERGDDSVSSEVLSPILMELSACLTVYRTYIRTFEVSARDRDHIEWAVAEARRRNPHLDDRAVSIVRGVLLLDGSRSLPPDQGARTLEFVMQWQQFTGPVTAKGLEDTALYNYNRLISLNEVGGDPGGDNLQDAVGRFHRRNIDVLRLWPNTMNASSTHDTKRSEDVRARINVLTEIPAAWARRLNRWSRLNGRKRLRIGGCPVPDPNEEVLIYQTLVGAWPLANHDLLAFRKRMSAYLIKAAREAKVHTNWLDPDEAYEGALVGFLEAILDSSDPSEFLDDFLRFQRRIDFYGSLNSLAQTLLKIAAPGIPDLYQGSELWSLDVVDPDNRRPVDFCGRPSFLREMDREPSRSRASLTRELVQQWRDGRLKLYLIAKALRFRRSHADLFQSGEYLPLQPSGERAENMVAFARRLRDSWAIAAVPRLATRLFSPGSAPPGLRRWSDTALVVPPGAGTRWVNVLTGEDMATAAAGTRRVLPADTLFRRLPVALLRNDSEGRQIRIS